MATRKAMGMAVTLLKHLRWLRRRSADAPGPNELLMNFPGDRFNWWFPCPRAMLWNLLAVAVLAVVASYLTFNTLGFWLNFAVVLTGVWLHIQFDMLKQLPKLHDEV